MPLRLEIKKILSSRSDRVKCVDMHPVEPWVLSALYSGSVFLWDFDQNTMVKSWEVCDLPVRTANENYAHLAAARGLRYHTLSAIASSQHGNYTVRIADAYAAAGLVLQLLVEANLVREPHASA